MDLSGRGKIPIVGEDRVRLLHAMCSQNVEEMKPGDGGYAFFLNAQGRILADANIFCFEDHFLVDTEPETARKLFDHLDRYVIADDVVLTDETESTATLAIEGPESESALRELGVTPPESEYALRFYGSCRRPMRPRRASCGSKTDGRVTVKRSPSVTWCRKPARCVASI